MGQTLTHGVYLPDEGERNCYDGLAANWQILDGSVGTIAAHTAALAGKAPLVHTHTKSDITDFPAYGNTAGTICEGNDSRLSDARTPVAHTHTKSDVTDLFNSANTWSGEQNFAASNINFKRSFTLGDNSYNICRLQYQDASLTRWGTVNFIHNTDNSVNCDIGVVAKKENDTVDVNASIRLTIKPDNSAELIPLNNNKINLGSSSYQWNNLYAKKVNTQSVNSINPGALSLPKTDSSITSIGTSGFSFDGSNERIPDTVNIFSNGKALMNGWLCARITEGAGHYIFLNSDDNTGKYGICASCFSSGVVSTLTYGINAYVPIKAGDKPVIIWAKPNGGGAQLIFYPCVGNV